MNRAAHRRRVNAALDRAMRTAERLRSGAATRLSANQRRAADRAERAVDGAPEPEPVALYGYQGVMLDEVARLDKDRFDAFAYLLAARPQPRVMTATEVRLREAAQRLEMIEPGDDVLRHARNAAIEALIYGRSEPR